MCTVSVVPTGGGIRILCNRDELRTRPAALPPAYHVIGNRVALFPSDPVSRGTWIGVNDAGLTLVMLNRTLAPATRTAGRPPASRGTVIPGLLGHRTVDSAIERAMALEPRLFAPFRLLLLQDVTVRIVGSDGRELSSTLGSADKPLLLTSSSLGDACVETPRRDLFERMVGHPRREWRQGQRRFHQHCWVDRPEISIVMHREDARTVSRTVVDVGPQTISMEYEPLPTKQIFVRRRLARVA